MGGVFDFLKGEWPKAFDSADKAAAAVYPDPRTACFYARRALELAVGWMFKHDPALRLPYQDNLSALIHEPTFRQVVGEAVFSKARLINTLANQAVHSHRAIATSDAITAVRELFHLGYWLARSYARVNKPAAGLVFDLVALPKGAPLPKQTVEQLQKLETDLRERDEKLSSLLADKNALNAELARLRTEIAEVRRAAEAQRDTHDYSEAETRDAYIDVLLNEAGWALDQERDREFEVAGMPNNQGKGFVDYVLWGDDGKPLALVEAKRTRRDPRQGKRQAELYADCLQEAFGQRPIIFYSNGYEHWIWDDQMYPPRQVQGFHKKSELALLIQRRTTRRPLATAGINEEIVGRYYQTRAIRRIGEAFERDHDRKALVVMATGAGKTRTVIALCDLLMRCNWAKRVLFLADRIALVNQAVGAFKKHLPDASPVNLVTDRDAEGRVFVSTYPTMMGLIDESRDGQRRFGVGNFDLIIIDEAHRSVYQKYRAIFGYFDSLLVGLTATPKEEVDRDTYHLFDLEKGVPTDAYGMDEAVKDKFLVPPVPVSVPTRFQREGIKYDDLSEEEKEQWDELEWNENGFVPSQVEAEAVNKWLFNKDTVDKVLAHLMTHGIKVAGGDRLGKTILFAKNQAHADFIAERFDANYPHCRGKFARVITFKVEYAQSLIDDFSAKDKAPHLAVSVDMLDTGIDVPEVVNLVFFKVVRSKTKFWQMIGRGTRLCEHLFGPDRHKTCFQIFDYCGNLEFFGQNPATVEGSPGEPLGKRLFKRRLEAIGELDKKLRLATQMADGPMDVVGDPRNEAELRTALAGMLHGEVAAMNLDNFVVRPKRRMVERYAQAAVWTDLTDEAVTELSQDVAGLPSELEPEPEEAKRFDLLILNLQLAHLRRQRAFERLRDQVKAIAGLLEEKSAIPMVLAQMPLIEDVQTEQWWQDVTTPMLERVRRRLRDLVQFIDKQSRRLVYSDFEDELGPAVEVELPGMSVGDDFERFRAKARVFLRAHQEHVAIHKLRMNRPLTPTDLTELERMLAESGIGGPEYINRAKENSHGLGVFVRSLVGMDRQAAKEAMTGFLAGKVFSANQIQFVNLIVDYLTEYGVIEASVLYESPFTDLTPRGPDGLFSPSEIDELFSAIETVRKQAIAG